MNDVNVFAELHGEFEAVARVAKKLSALPPIVDDGYPEARHHYESAVQTLIDKLRANGRFLSAGLTFEGLAAANMARNCSEDGFNHDPNAWSLSDWFTATMGELGDAANVAKKLNRARDGITGNRETVEALRENLADEIADTVIYLDLLAQSQGLSLSEIVKTKFNKTNAKIGYDKPLRDHG